MTLKEIAKKCGVSQAAVSRALNNNGYIKEEKKHQILEEIKKSGYKNSFFSLNKTKQISIITPDLKNNFYNEILENFMNNSFYENYDFSFFCTNYDANKELHSLEKSLENKVEAIIYIPSGTTYNDKKIIKFLSETKIPALVIDKKINCNRTHEITFDNVLGGYMLTELLIKNGHKNILFFNGEKGNEISVSREKGIRECFSNYGLIIPDKNIIYTSFQDYKIAYKKLLENNSKLDFTAIIAGNNIIAFGCLKFLNENKIKIGSDISFVSFDELEIFEIFDLKITVTSPNLKNIGNLAYSILREQINDTNSDIHRIKIIPEVIINGSEKHKNFK